MATDPVCGMDIDDESEYRFEYQTTIEWKQKSYLIRKPTLLSNYRPQAEPLPWLAMGLTMPLPWLRRMWALPWETAPMSP